MNILSSPPCPSLTPLLLALLLTGCANHSPQRPAGWPAGWCLRLDDPEARAAEVRVIESATGTVVDTGPNTILWRAEDTVRAPYRLSVQLHNLDSHGHPHGVGIFFGGANLDPTGAGAADQAYTYFLVRGDGAYLIKRRDGDSTREIQPWTLHSAVQAEDRVGLAQNILGVEVRETHTEFAVNGEVVHRVPSAELHRDGHFGFRMIHDLKVLFETPRCEPIEE